MDFDDSPDETQFRAQIRAWLDKNAPWHLYEEIRRSAIPGSLTITSTDPIVASQSWQLNKAKAGYACPSWPKEYGGGEMTPMQRVIWQQEEGVFHQLSLLFSIGFGMCGPTLMKWATQEQKLRLLNPMSKGEEIWCQLFSEPYAGSDLAGLRTSAKRAVDGSGDWVVNGQKIWTSYAHYAEWGLLLCRTNPDLPKHKGLTMFFVNMHSPGIEVRPIRQINGHSVFNEVFFHDVRIPDAQKLGTEGQGWEVSLTTLMNERMNIGTNVQTGFDQLFNLARRLETPTGRVIDDTAVQSKLAHWATISSGLKYTAMRAISAVSRGELPGPENSIAKLVAARTRQEISIFGLELQSCAGALLNPETEIGAEKKGDIGWFQANLLRSPAMRIEGGSDEILLNIIGERVLGLPPDIRIDKDIPFNQIKYTDR